MTQKFDHPLLHFRAYMGEKLLPFEDYNSPLSVAHHYSFLVGPLTKAVWDSLLTPFLNDMIGLYAPRWRLILRNHPADDRWVVRFSFRAEEEP